MDGPKGSWMGTMLYSSVGFTSSKKLRAAAIRTLTGSISSNSVLPEKLRVKLWHSGNSPNITHPHNSLVPYVHIDRVQNLSN